MCINCIESNWYVHVLGIINVYTGNSICLDKDYLFNQKNSDFFYSYFSKKTYYGYSLATS